MGFPIPGVFIPLLQIQVLAQHPVREEEEARTKCQRAHTGTTEQDVHALEQRHRGHGRERLRAEPEEKSEDQRQQHPRADPEHEEEHDGHEPLVLFEALPDRHGGIRHQAQRDAAQQQERDELDDKPRALCAGHGHTERVGDLKADRILIRAEAARHQQAERIDGECAEKPHDRDDQLRADQLRRRDRQREHQVSLIGHEVAVKAQDHQHDCRHDGGDKRQCFIL